MQTCRRTASTDSHTQNFDKADCGVYQHVILWREKMKMFVALGAKVRLVAQFHGALTVEVCFEDSYLLLSFCQQTALLNLLALYYNMCVGFYRWKKRCVVFHLECSPLKNACVCMGLLNVLICLCYMSGCSCSCLCALVRSDPVWTCECMQNFPLCWLLIVLCFWVCVCVQLSLQQLIWRIMVPGLQNHCLKLLVITSETAGNDKGREREKGKKKRDDKKTGREDKKNDWDIAITEQIKVRICWSSLNF